MGSRISSTKDRAGRRERSTGGAAVVPVRLGGAARSPRPRTRARVVILAGGRGTRLAPLTHVLPKPLVPLGDGPILQTLLMQLCAQGWREATLAVGYMADLIRAYFGTGTRFGIRLRYVEEETPLGTVGPLALLPANVVCRPLLVMNGDLLTDLSFRDFLAAHRSTGAIASVAIHLRTIRMEFGVLDLGEALGAARTVLAYHEKPEVTATVSMGVYAFEPEVLGYIARGERLDVPDLIQRLLDDGRTVAGYPFDGYWLDIGRHLDYERALDDYESVRGRLLVPAEAAT